MASSWPLRVLFMFPSWPSPVSEVVLRCHFGQVELRGPKVSKSDDFLNTEWYKTSSSYFQEIWASPSVPFWRQDDIKFGSFRSSWELGAQNTHIYDENRIFIVFRRESEAEFVTLCQNHKAANPRNRKNLQNPSGITYFYVFDVAN